MPHANFTEEIDELQYVVDYIEATGFNIVIDGLIFSEDKMLWSLTKALALFYLIYFYLC